MTTRSILLGLAFFAPTVLPALATGDNVLVVNVSKVALPSSLPGFCTVQGTVGQVWEGEAFQAGRPISIKVPCGTVSRLTPAVAVIGEPSQSRLISAEVLLKSKQGLARIDDTGALVWENSQRSYGPWGLAGGYRILDGAALDIAPRQITP